MRLRCASVLLVLLTATAFAQERVPVIVDATANDTVGQTFVYDLKEELGRSTIYRNVTDNGQKSIIVLKVVTLSAQDNDENNVSCSASMVLTLRIDDVYYYETLWVILVGRNQTAKMAHDMVGAMDNYIDKVRKPVK